MADDDYIRTTLVFVITFAAMYLALKRITKIAQTIGPRRLPMAPALPSFPFIGTIPYLPVDITQFPTFFKDKATMYGNVFSVKIGMHYMIVLNDRESTEEALVKRSIEFAGRPDNCNIGNPDRLGILDRSYHDVFKRYQQLTQKILKSFGFGRTSTMETRIQVQVERLMKALRSFDGCATNPELLVKIGVVNIISDLLYAKTYDLYDPDAVRLLDLIQLLVHYYAKTSPISMFPFLRFLPPFRQHLRKFEGAMQDIKLFMDARIDECSKGDIDDCYAKSFILLESTAASSFSRNELFYILRDFACAGTETSANTLLWGIVALANNPDVQRRLHEEINAVVPVNRFPSMDDQHRLPYVEATILELMRWKTMVKIASHITIEDTEVSGYFVPAGTRATFNLYAIHYDPSVFPNPEQFVPERFLDADGNVIGKKRIVSFSLGKRACMGQALAEQEIWLFFTTLIQQFNVIPPPGLQTVDCYEVPGSTTAPSAFEVRFVPRKVASK